MSERALCARHEACICLWLGGFVLLIEVWHKKAAFIPRWWLEYECKGKYVRSCPPRFNHRWRWAPRQTFSHLHSSTASLHRGPRPFTHHTDISPSAWLFRFSPPALWDILSSLSLHRLSEACALTLTRKTILQTPAYVCTGNPAGAHTHTHTGFNTHTYYITRACRW